MIYDNYKVFKMKNLKYNTVFMCAVMMVGCGGSNSNESAQDTSPNKPDQPTKPIPPITEKQKCDRGILLNSTLPSSSTSIFDQTLYQISSIYNPQTNQESILSEALRRDGQMLYLQYEGNNPDDLSTWEEDEALATDELVLNSSGLYTSTYYQKQNKGWPLGYITRTQDLNIQISLFDDQCRFQASPLNIEYEKVDVSGKKIADLIPQQALNYTAKNHDYLYLRPDLVNTLQRNKAAFNLFYNSQAVFPKNAYIYVPKKVILDDTQFYFQKNYFTEYKNLDEWIQNYPTTFKFVKDSVFGFNVTYVVNDKNQPIYSAGADPAIEMEGKIHDAEWQVKGDLISTSYGAPDEKFSENYSAKAEYAYLNQTTYTFIMQQYNMYYK